MIALSVALVAVALLAYRFAMAWLDSQRPFTPNGEAVRQLAEQEVRLRALEARAGMVRNPFPAVKPDEN